MNELKPIQTSYRGCYFRSRLEARWAVCFDQMGVEWEYELEGFELPSGRYLPDFWLPQVSMWAEVKPTRLDGREFALCRELAIDSGFDVLLLDSKPTRRYYSAISSQMLPGAPGADRDRGVPIMVHYDLFERHRYWLYEHRFFFVEYGKTLEASRYSRAPRYWFDGEYEHAGRDQYADQWITAALSARFEHGESGATL